MTLANASTFLKVLASVRAGETIELAPGDYPKVRIKGLEAKGGLVVLAAADPASPPRFTESLTIDGASDLEFRGIAFDISSAAAGHAPAIKITGGARLALTGGRIVGRLMPDDRWGYGLTVSGVAGLTIRGMQVRDVRRGFVFSECEDLLVEANDLESIGSDGIDLSGVLRAKLLANRLADFHPVGTDHPDAIQIMAPGAVRACEDILLEANLIETGLGRRPQGIFVKSENGRRHQRIRIIDNRLVNVAFNAISVRNTDDVVISGNDVQFRRGADPMPDKAWIQTEDSTGTASGNRVMRLLLGPGVTGGGGVEIGEDVTGKGAVDLKGAWLALRRPQQVEPPARDELRESVAKRTVVKREPLKTKGRVSLDFRTPAEADVFMAAVEAVARA